MKKIPNLYGIPNIVTEERLKPGDVVQHFKRETIENPENTTMYLQSTQKLKRSWSFTRHSIKTKSLV